MRVVPKPKSKPRKKRKRLPSLRSLFKKAEREFNGFIRELDGCCVLCGSRELLTAGHVLTAAFKSTKYDEMNTFGQCSGCNMKHEHHPELYISWYIKHFGQEAWDGLVQRHWEIKKYTRTELNELIDKYRALRRGLEKEPERVRETRRSPFE